MSKRWVAPLINKEALFASQPSTDAAFLAAQAFAETLLECREFYAFAASDEDGRTLTKLRETVSGMLEMMEEWEAPTPYAEKQIARYRLALPAIDALIRAEE